MIVYQFLGTEDEAKKKILELIEEDKISDKENYEGGTSTSEEISLDKSGSLLAFSRYSYYHISYGAKKIKDIEKLP